MRTFCISAGTDGSSRVEMADRQRCSAPTCSGLRRGQSLPRYMHFTGSQHVSAVPALDIVSAWVTTLARASFPRSGTTLAVPPSRRSNTTPTLASFHRTGATPPGARA